MTSLYTGVDFVPTHKVIDNNLNKSVLKTQKYTNPCLWHLEIKKTEIGKSKKMYNKI